ncbi:uncharacterized protein LOC100115194 [Nasonia vitripennis]|uniref:Uncharacterized protein n=1 Tax=Nasonia vitripennis TaxID=7425 RepID=A0A7M7G5G4_NASVI|nr:uncharacterized protein LOC100115194 [Nasonia vitripennis]
MSLPETTKHNEGWAENYSSDIIQERPSQQQEATVAEAEESFEEYETRVKQMSKKIKKLEAQLQECSYQKDILLEKYRKFFEQQDQINRNFQRYINSMEFTTPLNGRINHIVFAPDPNQCRLPPTVNNNTKGPKTMSHGPSTRRSSHQAESSSYYSQYQTVAYYPSQVFAQAPEPVAAPVNGFGDTRSAIWTNPPTTHQMSQPTTSYYHGPPYAQNNPGPLSQPLAIVTDQSQLGGYQTYMALAPLPPQIQTNSAVQQFPGPVAYYYEPTVAQNRAPNIECQHHHGSS